MKTLIALIACLLLVGCQTTQVVPKGPADIYFPPSEDPQMESIPTSEITTVSLCAEHMAQAQREGFLAGPCVYNADSAAYDCPMVDYKAWVPTIKAEEILNQIKELENIKRPE